nr:MAG TPA: hypothetical protein [Caudoviricetes sp.]
MRINPQRLMYFILDNIPKKLFILISSIHEITVL